jgi:hypothetical protein
MIAESRDYSVNIAGRLVVADKTISIGQICRRHLVVIGDCEIPPESEGRLIVTVNGREKVYNIFLPHGINRQSESAEFF